MPQPIDLSQSHEFRDAAGRVMGYYVPAPASSSPRDKSDTPGAGAVGAKPWEEEFRELIQERDHLRAEVEALRAERDQYRKAVAALTRDTFTFDKQALLTPDPARPTLEQVIRELESVGESNHVG